MNRSLLLVDMHVCTYCVQVILNKRQESKIEGREREREEKSIAHFSHAGILRNSAVFYALDCKQKTI